MEVNGIAHIFLTASNYERSRDFYRKLLPFLGMKPVIDTERSITASVAAPRSAISAPSPEHAGAAFEQKRVGLHHLCFRARERADVDELHAFLDDARRQDHSRAARGSMGAGILFDPVRRSRWHPARTQSCAGEGAAGVVQQCVGWVERSETHHAVSRKYRWVSLRSTHPTPIIPLSGKRSEIRFSLRLAAVCAMRHDRAEQYSKPQAMRQ